MDPDVYFGQLFYCKFRFISSKTKKKEDKPVQKYCPWKYYYYWKIAANPKGSSFLLSNAEYILYLAEDQHGNKNTSAKDHATWNPDHPPLVIPQLKVNPLWQSDDLLHIKIAAEKIYQYSQNIVYDKTLSQEQKDAFIQNTSTKSFKLNAQYKTKIQHKLAAVNINDILKNPFVGNVTLKSNMNDNTMTISIYSSRLIHYIITL